MRAVISIAGWVREVCSKVDEVDDITERQRVRWKMKYKKVQLYRLYRAGGIELG